MDVKAALTQAPLSIFSRECTFVAGVTNLAQMPEMVLPEMVFCGRSNVGKSSLLNALTNRNSLARTSSTPGHTRQLNFFDLAGIMMLVDVPGYGYAKAPKHLIKSWTELLFTYLRGRPQLLRACVLLDARQGVRDSDEEMMTLLDDAAVSYQLVLTKVDKVTPDLLQQAEEGAKSATLRHVAAHPIVLSTSAESRIGIDALRLSLVEAILATRQGA